MSKKSESEKKYGWELNSGLFEVHWKGTFADRVRICGTVFHYLEGKKVKTPSAAVKTPEGRT
jgi:hypothetical protein